MATPLIKNVYRFNQALALPLFSNVIIWDHRQSKWTFEQRKWKRFLHFFIAFGIVAPCMLSFLLLRSAAALLNPEPPSKKEQFVMLAIFSYLMFELVHDLIVFKYGEDLGKLTNVQFDFGSRNFREIQLFGRSKQKQYEIPDIIGLFLL